MTRYFSERELGEAPRINTEITENVWRGIAGLIEQRLNDGSLGLGFPRVCEDSPTVCCGADKHGFEVSIKAKIPALLEELQIGRWNISTIEQPPLTVIMDIIEFCWESVGSPMQGGWHDYSRHYHLTFDKSVGQSEFMEELNLIFRRNGVAFSLTEYGKIERLLPAELDSLVRNAVFQTGDAELDHMLETSRRKYLSPDENERREALEKLWDAWERLKTIKSSDKQAGAQIMLDQAAGSSSPKFRTTLEEEAIALTNAGNKFQIRHSETTQEHLNSSDHVDYLFCRMLALLNLILKSL